MESGEIKLVNSKFAGSGSMTPNRRGSFSIQSTKGSVTRNTKKSRFTFDGEEVQLSTHDKIRRVLQKKNRDKYEARFLFNQLQELSFFKKFREDNPDLNSADALLHFF